MSRCQGYAAREARGALAPFLFDRRDPGPTDVAIEILYCGICHTDIHKVTNEWGHTNFPIVPGHEVIGRVSAVGSEVRRFAKGDLAGVGCIVDSCRVCPACLDGEQQFCEKGVIYADNCPDRHLGGFTRGGYSRHTVVDEAYVLKVSPKVDLAGTAPLLCAGITTYSPLRRFRVGPGQKVGIVGLGGLGHMALKFARSFGAHVTLFTGSPGKKEDAFRLGADEVIVSSDANAMSSQWSSFDLIVDAVSAPHDVNLYLTMLKRGGNMVLLGVPPEVSMHPHSLIRGRRSLSGSLIGGIPETQEMLDYCAEHGITADVEVIPIQQVNEAYERTLKADVKYRFVIDMASLGG